MRLSYILAFLPPLLAFLIKNYSLFASDVFRTLDLPSYEQHPMPTPDPYILADWKFRRACPATSRQFFSSVNVKRFMEKELSVAYFIQEGHLKKQNSPFSLMDKLIVLQISGENPTAL